MLNKKLPVGNNQTFIIAEIGTTHGGNLEKAVSLIHAARDGGADCVKFQYVIAEEIIHPKTGKVNLPGGHIPLFARFKELENPPDFYDKLRQESEKAGLTFLCTPFGLRSAAFLKDMNVEAIKIASPELNHYPLLEAVNDFPLILSTGVSTMCDIERALKFCPEESAILHCITAYPAPETEYNLKLITSLKNILNRPVGISDHSRNPILVPSLAASLKCYAIEKHITLSNSGDGLDDPIALNPRNFSIMCKSIRKAEKEGYNETISERISDFGAAVVFETLGDGVKKLSPSEADNYATTNRSIMAVSDIKKGEPFTTQNTALLRSEKQLTPGLPPDYYNIILGKKAVRFIKSSEGITSDCF